MGYWWQLRSWTSEIRDKIKKVGAEVKKINKGNGGRREGRKERKMRKGGQEVYLTITLIILQGQIKVFLVLAQGNIGHIWRYANLVFDSSAFHL